MIKIAIVEDEAMYAKQLEEFLHQYEAENQEAFEITIYSDGDQISVRHYPYGCRDEIHGWNVSCGRNP